MQLIMYLISGIVKDLILTLHIDYAANLCDQDENHHL